MTIYEIDEAIQNCIDTETGEVDESRLNELLLERDTKIEQLACWVIDLEAAAKAISEQQQVLGKRKEAALHKADSIRQYIAAALAGQKFSTSKVQISFRRSSSVVVPDIEQLADEYKKFGAPTANKTAIKDALKLGVDVQGAYLEENTSMVIK